jgi:hypothetical protein
MKLTACSEYNLAETPVKRVNADLIAQVSADGGTTAIVLKSKNAVIDQIHGQHCPYKIDGRSGLTFGQR